MKILEKRILTNIRLTDNQKEVLSKLYLNKDNPRVGEEDLTNSSYARNLLAARDMLVRLGLLTRQEGGHVPTEKGVGVMDEYNLVDETGELTDTGEEFAYKGQEQDPEVGGDDISTFKGDDEEFESFESFEILKQITNLKD